MSIAEGTYRGRAVAGSEQYGTTSNGNDQIVLNLELIDLGETVSTFLFFSEKAAPHSMKRLRLLGWQGNDLADLSGIDANEVDVRVFYEEYQGEQKMKVEIVSGCTVSIQQVDDNGKKAFAAKYKALAATTAPVNGAKAKASGAQF